MGSLTSRPKAPSAPQTVYVPTYTPAPVAAPVSTPAPAAETPAAAPAPAPAAPDAPTPQAARESSLLERSRGVLSTVLTGFRGVLSSTTAPSGRKTLLGE